jgi:hydroxyacylglutathione hydrolase
MSFYKFMQANSNYYLQQLSTECLSQFAYFIESAGEAVLIDPLRHSAPYLELLQQRNAKLKYILLTHFHADFVSGHITLQEKTGAEIVMGPTAQPEFKAHVAKDGEVLKLGEINIRVVHTPGHTMESSCYVINSNGSDQCVFTGDTVFLGDVGRPDLSVDPNVKSEDLAALLFDSVKKLKAFSDDVVLYPGHGAGSPCGKAIQSGVSCTIGKQKQSNYALKIEDKATFIKEICKNLGNPPKYFFHDAAMNRQGKITDTDEILKECAKELNEAEFAKLLANPDYIAIDTRDFGDFKAGHIQGTVAVPLSIKYAIFGATIIGSKNVILVCEPGKEEESIIRLTRTGVDNIKGYLKDGVGGWSGPLVKTESMDPHTFAELHAQDKVDILDVREKNELVDAKLPHVIHMSINVLADNYQTLPKDVTLFTVCKTGGRAMIANSFLEGRGFRVVNVDQGMTGLEKTSVTIHRENHHL